MGNCIFKDYYNHTTSSSKLHEMQVAEQTSMIKVVTTTGGIMELYAPITAEQITSEFPNHGLFLGPNPTLAPLSHNDNLSPGQLYYLLPLSLTSTSTNTNNRDSSISSTPYRMSVDVAPRVVYKEQPDPDVVPGYSGSGMWKVRLVINPEQLSDILSQDNKTQQLIESVRTVAKCGSGGGGSSGAKTTSSERSSGNSDQCSVSSCNFQRKG